MYLGLSLTFFQFDKCKFRMHYLWCTQSPLCLRESPKEQQQTDNSGADSLVLCWGKRSTCPFRSVCRASPLLTSFLWWLLSTVEPVLFGNIYAHCMALFPSQERPHDGGLTSSTQFLWCISWTQHLCIDSCRCHLPGSHLRLLPAACHRPCPPYALRLGWTSCGGIDTYSVDCPFRSPASFRVNVWSEQIRHNFSHPDKLLHVCVFSSQR